VRDATVQIVRGVEGGAMTDGARPARRPDALVGRADELESLGQLLDGLDQGDALAVELLGEPGIGKTRMLSEFSNLAEQRGHLVLSGSASELERELPFSVFVDALDEYVESLDPELLAELDDDVQAELAHVLPSLSALAAKRSVALQHERYRSHRAVRALLERITQARPLLLVLDDLHWADSASAELVGALLRRPPTAAVLIAIAHRPRPTQERFATALERAYRDGALSRLNLEPLTQEEAREFLGENVDAAGAAVLYEESGGNPFYLEQLRRSGGGISAGGASLSGLGVPSAVAASLAEELALLSGGGRLLLEGAAVAGDPFSLELAAAAAATSETAAADAIDELVQLDLLRTTDAPRRFRFRHPLVRRAVYEAAAAGWRLGAHERCAEALAALGASGAARAHHVERSARQGDVAAVAVLREAGESAARLAPESAARWFAAALHLLPGSASVEERVDLLRARAGALAAAGYFPSAHEALLEAVALVPQQSHALRTAVATSCAGVERFLGRYEQAHTRLVEALRELPPLPSVESVELRIELTLNEFYRSHYKAMHDWASRAVADAKALENASLTAAALAMPAFAYAMTGSVDRARLHRAEAAALVDELSDYELAHRHDAAGWLAITELYLDMYEQADAHATRALALARASGGGDPLHRFYPVLPRVWYVRGKLAEAAELLDGAIEGGRLLGSPPALAGNLFNRSVVALATGEMDLALATAEEGVELTRSLDDGFVAAWAAARLAAVLLELGQAERAVELLLDRAGGEELTFIPGSWRAYFLELLTRCWLALDRRDAAERAARLAETVATAARLPLMNAWADRAVAAVALDSGDAERAAERALASAKAAREVGAPIEDAVAGTLAGKALAAAGKHDRAVLELQHAAATLDACGALRLRDKAERELGKLGRRPHRRTQNGKTDAAVIDALTQRELQLARLVVDRKTNREIAVELFLSKKTVEAHLRNIFRKVGVSSRVELARTIERSNLDAHS
jgi:ATP/maltotriose-dependent transcriptional regulator MalT